MDTEMVTCTRMETAIEGVRQASATLAVVDQLADRLRRDDPVTDLVMQKSGMAALLNSVLRTETDRAVFRALEPPNTCLLYTSPSPRDS